MASRRYTFSMPNFIIHHRTVRFKLWKQPLALCFYDTQFDIHRYWPDDRESMTFKEVCNILRQEPAVNEADLLRAFERFDINGDGFVSLDEMLRLLTSKGEKMEVDEVERIMINADANRDGKLDYRYSEFRF